VRRESVEKQVKSGLGTFLRKKNFLALKAINLQWALRFLSLGHWLPLFRRHFWKQSHEAALCGGKFHNLGIYDHLVGGLEHFGTFFNFHNIWDNPSH
jgi:hypothetical protein